MPGIYDQAHGGYPEPDKHGHPEGTRNLENYQRTALENIVSSDEQEAIAEAAMNAYTADWLRDNPGHPFAGNPGGHDFDHYLVQAASWRSRGGYGGAGMHS